ncbi:MAG: PDZ domain-containing protein [Candidatus Hydrogenedens sp.]|nr:PDZ domain-containing protein [Candidatus Hydrogenedens sp.]
MQKQKSKFEFAALLTFLTAAALLLSNGFVSRISADDDNVDVYRKIEPIGGVLATIQREYVRDADIDVLVEGALRGMMRSLDAHSSYISASDLEQMREDTRGEFEGIGVSIRLDEDGRVMVVAPISGSPAAEAGLLPFDLIMAIDDIPTDGMTTADAADKIRGQRGTTVKLSILRMPVDEKSDPEVIDIEVKRDRVPLVSIGESGLIDGKIGYIRVKDFKETTARDMRDKINGFLDNGMQSLIIDLRWNPGGLLNSSVEVCELFFDKGTLVTYTEGRKRPDGSPNRDDMRYKTQRSAVVPKDMPVVILVNNQTASSSEIVTGAMQFYQRALVVGEKTFGKGSVQTIIPLERPENTALRLTTALYYTPAEVTIDHEGIKPDVESTMDQAHLIKLVRQMDRSFEADPMGEGILDHGTISGYKLPEGALAPELKEGEEAPEHVEDLQLKRAVELLREDSVWENLIKKYHKSVKETQVAHVDKPADAAAEGSAAGDDAAAPAVEAPPAGEVAPEE